MILKNTLVCTEEEFREYYKKYKGMPVKSADVRSYKDIINGLNIKSDHPVDNNLFLETELLSILSQVIVHIPLDKIEEIIERDRQWIDNLIIKRNKIDISTASTELAKLLKEMDSYIKSGIKDCFLIEMMHDELNKFYTDLTNDLLKFFKTSSTGVYGIEDFSMDYELLLQHLENSNILMKDGIKNILDNYAFYLMLSLDSESNITTEISLSELSKAESKVRVYLKMFYALPLVLHITFKYRDFSKMFIFNHLQDKEKEVFRNILSNIPFNCFRIFVNSKYTPDGCLTIIKNHKGEIYVNL